jgi:hypothetical protein
VRDELGDRDPDDVGEGVEVLDDAPHLRAGRPPGLRRQFSPDTGEAAASARRPTAGRSVGPCAAACAAPPDPPEDRIGRAASHNALARLALERFRAPAKGGQPRSGGRAAAVSGWQTWIPGWSRRCWPWSSRTSGGFPAGTSKWNKVEHRLFSHITMNWRGRPLSSHEVIVQTIAATTTRTGLRVHAALDTSSYDIGVRIADRQLAALPLTRHDWHGDWNYTLHPETYEHINTAPDPFDQPSPDLAWLRHPALTGLPTQQSRLVAWQPYPKDASSAALHEVTGLRVSTLGSRPRQRVDIAAAAGVQRP